jgi:hypothetical protein
MQLDFLGNTTPRTLAQASLFDDVGKATKLRATPDYAKANAYFQSITKAEIEREAKYWASITPINDSEKFQRYLFAFMSVHTSWESNIKGYQAIKDWTAWFNSPDKLKTLLEGSKVGLHNQRTRFVETFSKSFWTGLKKFNKLSSESWTQYRNRLEKDILGLGIAKTSFALEMIHPLECQVTCMDTHLFQLYGLDQSRDKAQYEAIEAHWIQMCKLWNVPSYIARCIWWDRNQNQADSRYWSYVLEN